MQLDRSAGWTIRQMNLTRFVVSHTM